jgi:hypothetical protein
LAARVELFQQCPGLNLGSMEQVGGGTTGREGSI